MRIHTFLHRHHMKDQILESVSEHRTTTNHTVHQYLPPHWSIQLLHCTSDLSPQICFLSHSYWTYQALTWVCCRCHGAGPSLCWHREVERVALFVEMCSAIQFHSSVSDESCRSIRREGTVIERQWSSSCVLLLYFYFFCLHLSSICVGICPFLMSLCHLCRSNGHSPCSYPHNDVL